MNSGLQHGYIVLEAPDPHVAVMAKKAPYVTKVVAMINVKVAATAGVFSATRCTLALLCFQCLGVPPQGHTVARLQGVVLGESWINSSPFFGALRYFAEVLFSPFSMAFVLAALAIDLVARHSAFGFAEQAEMLDRNAPRARFDTRRDVEIFSTGHESFLFFAQRNKLSYAMQGQLSWL